MSADIARRRA